MTPFQLKKMLRAAGIEPPANKEEVQLLAQKLLQLSAGHQQAQIQADHEGMLVAPPALCYAETPIIFQIVRCQNFFNVHAIL